MVSVSHDVKEQAVLLGPARSMVAVITPAAPAHAETERPCAVILNSGILHRVGANRMSVVLARTLAAWGITAVRFDQSGIGDSAPRTDALPPLEAGKADITEALDTLEATTGVSRFLLAGLCSGADLSLITSATDPRVVGAVMLDPAIPRTYHHWLHHYRRRALRSDAWLSLVRGDNPIWKKLKQKLSGGRQAEALPEPPNLNDPEVRAFLADTYRQALAKGVELLVITSGERRPYGNQLLDTFPDVPFGDQLRLEYFPMADHVFTGARVTESVINTIVDWTTSTHFVPAPPRAGDAKKGPKCA